MAASVILTSHHGSADDASTTDIAGSTIFFKNATDTDPSGGAVVHNGAGINYSMIKQIQFRVATTPLHSVSNLKFYFTGAAVANIDIKAKISLTYRDATIATGQGTTALTGVTSMYTYTANAPLSLDGTFTVGTDSAPKFIGGFLQLQVAVGNAAVLSPTPLGSLIGRYDES